jgi:uncharacterized membrane protein YoaK (UPF0700 family)
MSRDIADPLCLASWSGRQADKGIGQLDRACARLLSKERLRRLTKTWASITVFAFGSLAGGFSHVEVGFWALLLPCFALAALLYLLRKPDAAPKEGQPAFM